MLYYFDSNNPKAPAQIGHILTNMVTDIILPNQEIIILCIGSDRSTGDSLGPVIGHKFKDFISPGLYLLGDLNQPIHATNLNHCIKSIQKTFDNPFIIAIDASLGKEEHIGMITLGKGPLKPGLGVKKDCLKLATSTSQELLILPTTWSHPHFRQPVCPLYSR